VSSIAQYLDPGLWRDMLYATFSNSAHSAFWVAIAQIVLINITLSGDNAVVIAMACRGLPPRQRLWGLVIGEGLAVICLIVFTAIVTRLLTLPYVKLGGGLALLFIAARLLLPERDDRDEVETTARLWRAVWLVLAADIVMSLDNIIAIAAVAQGNVALLAIGLAVCIPIIVAGAALIAALLDRFPILVWAGAALLGWLAGAVIPTDPALSGYVKTALGESLAERAELAASGLGAILVVALGGLWRKSRLAKMHTAPGGE